MAMEEAVRAGVFDPVPVLSEPTRWRELAACRGLGPPAFFGTRPAFALARCRCCPVDEICFWYAMAAEEEAGYRFGVWGRTIPTLRAQIATLVGVGYAHRRLADLAAGVEPLPAGV